MSTQSHTSWTQRLNLFLQGLEDALLVVYGSADLGVPSPSPPRPETRLAGVLGTWQIRLTSSGRSYLVAL